jgi:hypothetical protein
MRVTAIDATNEPVKIQIGGGEHAVRSIGILRLLSVLERYILDSEIRRFQSMALCLQGPERLQYVKDMTDRLPSGTELERKAFDLMARGDTPESVGIEVLALALVGTYTIEEVGAIYSRASADEVRLALTIATVGVKKNERSRPRRWFGNWRGNG